MIVRHVRLLNWFTGPLSPNSLKMNDYFSQSSIVQIIHPTGNFAQLFLLSKLRNTNSKAFTLKEKDFGVKHFSSPILSSGENAIHKVCYAGTDSRTFLNL